MKIYVVFKFNREDEKLVKGFKTQIAAEKFVERMDIEDKEYTYDWDYIEVE